jgi:hypothetical protein
VTASTKEEIKNFKRTKRFVKAVGTIGGSSPSFAFAVSIGMTDFTIAGRIVADTGTVPRAARWIAAGGERLSEPRIALSH